MIAVRNRSRSLARPRRGQAVIETALVLPLLLTLVFGIAEMGLYMYDYVQAANCAREAARRASVRDPLAASPPYCISATLQPTLSPATYATAPGGSIVTATVNSTHTWLVIGNLIPGIGPSKALHATVVMRMEGLKL
jgi:Flp pilus assembly protein TadG